MNKPFSINLRVYAEDTDFGGIVYHSRYLNFMERARTEWLIALGFSLKWFEEQNCYFVIRKAEIDYIKPAQLNELLSVSVTLKKLTTHKIIFAQSIYPKDNINSVYVNAEFKLGCVNKEQKLIPLHKALIEQFLSKKESV